MECEKCKSKELEDKLIDTNYRYSDYFEEDIKDNPKMVRDRFRAVLVHNLTKSLRLNEI